MTLLSNALRIPGQGKALAHRALGLPGDWRVALANVDLHSSALPNTAKLGRSRVVAKRVAARVFPRALRRAKGLGGLLSLAVDDDSLLPSGVGGLEGGLGLLSTLFALGKSLVEVPPEPGPEEGGPESAGVALGVELPAGDAGLGLGLVLDDGAEAVTHVGDLGSVVPQVTGDLPAGQEHPDQGDLTVLSEQLGDGRDRAELHGDLDGDDVGDLPGLEHVVGQASDALDLGALGVELELGGLLEGVAGDTPVLGQPLDVLESGQELDGEKALGLLADLPEEVVVLGQVFVGKVKF